jgi:phage terminase large subunit GpA-like protein
MDRLDHFPRVWCPTCNKVQPLIFDVLKANDKNEQDAADILCAECKAIIATLHARRIGRRDKKVAKASERWRLRKGPSVDP